MAPLTTDDPGTADGPAPAGSDRTMGLAEELLTRRHGATVRLADPQDLGGSDRSLVVRVRVAENPFSLPRTLVIKHYMDSAADAPYDSATDRFRYEAASCQLFTALPAEQRPSPMLVAHDPGHRLLVLEDLGRCATLADRLDENDPKAAERALLGWARALGRMQASTAGREHDFGALLRRFGERAWRDPLADDARVALAEVPDMLAGLLRVEAAPAAVEQARGAARLLGGSGFRAFSPSEVCPDNCLVTGSGARFLDFEWGCFRDIALTAASLRLPFPGCVPARTLPAGMAQAMLASWHAEVVGVWPELGDLDTMRQRLLQAELLWVWLCTRSLLPAVVGDTGERPVQVVVADPGTDAAGVLATHWRCLADDAVAEGWTETARLAEAVLAALDHYGGDVPLTVYPAFA